MCVCAFVIYMHSFNNRESNVHASACSHSHVYTRMYTLIHNKYTHSHTHTHTHAHTLTHSQEIEALSKAIDAGTVVSMLDEKKTENIESAAR
jgi:hypothetical protein